MSIAHGYSIWLMPEGESFDKLQNIISDLGKRYGGPIFPPHVTLLGSIEQEEEKVVSACEEISKKTRGMSLYLDKVVLTAAYFQSLFFNVRSNPEIIEANNLVKNVLGVSKEKFHPHLSILYGALDPKHKEKIVRDLSELLPISLKMSKLRLIKADGEVKDWTKIRDFVLA